MIETPRIGLIATLLSTQSSYRSAGLHTYSHQLLHHLAASETPARWHAFVGDPSYQSPADLLVHAPSRSLQNPWLRIAWEQSILPVLAARLRLDLIHGFVHTLPLPIRMPGVVTVHDLSFMRYPQAFRPANRFYLRHMAALSCRRARHIIAVSQATRRDIQRYFHIPAERISVIYNGVDAVYRPLPPGDVAAYARQAGWPRRFILTVGTLEPRKNHLGLLDAYARYRQMSDDPLPLLIGGGKGWYYDTIFARVQELSLDRYVHFLGFVPLDMLPWLYNSATLFVYPSLYEGFGLPLAEAMACGVPCITSTRSSLPEVAGDAALCVAPDRPDELATAMHAVLGSPAKQAAMRQAGLSHSAQFRWHSTADATVQVYHHVLQSAHHA